MRANFLLIALFAGALFACAPPQIDSTGAVACGPTGECPTGFQCRFGRCCDGDAGYAMCPVTGIERRADGTLACDAAGRCPNVHGYQCRYGRACCPSGTDGTGLCSAEAGGQSCRSAAGQGCLQRGSIPPQTPFCLDRVAACLIEVPNGYRTQKCDTGDLTSCGANALCLQLDGSPLCAARCRFPKNSPYTACRTEPDGDPRPLYTCFPIAPGDSESTEGYCYIDCAARPETCPEALGYTCNCDTHACALTANVPMNARPVGNVCRSMR